MNFFENQDRSRRNTKLLVFLFVIAVIGVVAAVTAVAAFAAAYVTRDAKVERIGLPDSEWVGQNAGFLLLVAAVTLAAILIASLVRSAEMRDGGSAVARSMGGRLVRRTTERLAERRLLNVVEEMAIASGVPVPEVYLLDEEEGINAFAAGYTPADAAIGVTRGTVENLSREELQGVIAHEFSHILNGDMRLNQRLIGLLFGILFLAVTGRVLLHVFRFSGRGRRDRDGGNLGAAIMIVALGLFVVGSIGVFFGRLIKAAVSRQREFLADASAVQFTRNPQGLGGALKLIAIGPGSFLKSAKTEEVSHMLFGKGRRSLQWLWSTHPPIERRIRAVEPSFDPAELEDVARKWRRRKVAALEAAAARKKTRAKKPAEGDRLPISPEILTGAAGTVDPMRLVYAVGLLASLPDDVHAAASSLEEVPFLVLGLLLSSDAEVRAKQRAALIDALDERSADRVERFSRETSGLGPGARLPLLDLALPALRQYSDSDLDELVQTARALILADDRVEPFEFALAKTLETRRDGVVRPAAAVHGSGNLSERRDAVGALLATLAGVGAPDAGAARAAYDAGVAWLPGEGWSDFAAREPWAPHLDRALDELADLAPLEKGKLVEAITAVVGHDGVVAVAEAELLRAICAALHVPVPPLFNQAFDEDQGPPQSTA